MSESKRAWIAIAALGVLLGPGSAAAGEPGHREAAPPYDPTQYTPEQRVRIERLFYQVICDCPEENWRGTLAGCPANCADPQKRMIRDGVKRGLTDQQILDEQLKLHGGDQRVLAVPDSLMASLFPYLVLAGFTVLVVVVLAVSVRRGAAAKSSEARAGPPATGAVPGKAPGAPPAAAWPETDADRRIAAAVERDLQEMDG